VAARLGAAIEGKAELFGYQVDLWVTTRDRWQRSA
jgi:hypothetical protein